VTRVKKSRPNPMNTNQWAAPTSVHWSILVWPRVSLNMFAHRAPLSFERFTAGWPIRAVAMICWIAFTNRAMATAVMPNDTTRATIWTASMNAPRRGLASG
jgi:hypothetical protein